MLGVIKEFQVDCSQLHNDSTSITVHGDYTAADGRARAGKPTVAATLGHSKDHRPDLKQFVLTLTVSADGAVPLAHRLLDGNTNDDQTHITTWDDLVALVGSPGFLYVADCKLATREQMSHIDSHHGRFLSILPRSRAEDPQIREWAQTHPFDWTEAARRPGKRKGDPDQVYWTAPAPIPTSEGHRITWVRSSQKPACDADARHARIEQGMQALEGVQARLASPRSRLKTRLTAEQAARDALAAPAPNAGSPSRSPTPSRKASARRNAAAPANRPATARPPRRSSRSPSPSTTNRSPTTPPPTGNSRSSPTTTTSPTPNCSPPTATNRTSRNATTNSRPCSAPPPSS